MKIRSAIALGILLLIGTLASAQDYPKVEIPVVYSYMRFVPQNNNILNSFSLNGGGVGISFYLTPAFGSKRNLTAMPAKHETLLRPAPYSAPRFARVACQPTCSPTTWARPSNCADTILSHS
jgi:hypothetical protein